MSDAYSKMKGEYDAIMGTTLWHIFSHDLQVKLRYFQSQLYSNKNIGDSITRGEYWQGIVQTLQSILAAPENIVGKAKKDAISGEGNDAV